MIIFNIFVKMLGKKTTIKLKELTPRKNIVWKSEHYNMVDNIIESYDIKKGIITVSKDNKVLDGNHRYTILHDYYGDEHEIIVNKKPLKRWVYVLTKVLIGLSIFPIILIYHLFKQYINNKIKNRLK